MLLCGCCPAGDHTPQGQKSMRLLRPAVRIHDGLLIVGKLLGALSVESVLDCSVTCHRVLHCSCPWSLDWLRFGPLGANMRFIRL
jgi:hypothetical protein